MTRVLVVYLKQKKSVFYGQIYHKYQSKVIQVKERYLCILKT